MGSMIPLPKMRQYDIKYIEYVRNKKVKRFDKTMPNCLICWDIIDQKTHICCNICDIRNVIGNTENLPQHQKLVHIAANWEHKRFV